MKFQAYRHVMVWRFIVCVVIFMMVLSMKVIIAQYASKIPINGLLFQSMITSKRPQKKEKIRTIH